MRADLIRPHIFAYERVGFIFARKTKGEGESLVILATEYTPIKDKHYIEDPDVGAKVNSEAIRQAMERAYFKKECVFHVHQHEHFGQPKPSRTDWTEYQKLIPSFHNAGKNAVHGALILSLDNVLGLLWTSKTAEPYIMTKISMAGYPLEIYRYERK